MKRTTQPKQTTKRSREDIFDEMASKWAARAERLISKRRVGQTMASHS